MASTLLYEVITLLRITIIQKMTLNNILHYVKMNEYRMSIKISCFVTCSCYFSHQVPDYCLSYRYGRSSRPFGRLWWNETVPTVFCYPDPHSRVCIFHLVLLTWFKFEAYYFLFLQFVLFFHL